MDKKIKIKWFESVWFFDVDDTLCDTSDISSDATIGIARVFESKFGTEVAKLVQEKVNDCYALMLEGARIGVGGDWTKVLGGKAAFNELMTSMKDRQKEVIAEYGNIKRWSREVFIKIVADDLGINVTLDLVQEAAAAYWQEVADRTNVFADALKLIESISLHNRPIYLLTSSDARLKMKGDGQFIYDPAYSESLKRERIEALRKKGIKFNLLSIGDPEDKPHQDFFDKAIGIAEKNLSKKIDLSQSVMVGDSFGSDLETPKDKMGFGLVVLINRTSSHFEIIDEHQVNTSDLSKITELVV